MGRKGMKKAKITEVRATKSLLPYLLGKSKPIGLSEKRIVTTIALTTKVYQLFQAKLIKTYDAFNSKDSVKDRVNALNGCLSFHLSVNVGKRFYGTTKAPKGLHGILEEDLEDYLALLSKYEVGFYVVKPILKKLGIISISEEETPRGGKEVVSFVFNNTLYNKKNIKDLDEILAILDSEFPIVAPVNIPNISELEYKMWLRLGSTIGNYDNLRMMKSIPNGVPKDIRGMVSEWVDQHNPPWRAEKKTFEDLAFEVNERIKTNKFRASTSPSTERFYNEIAHLPKYLRRFLFDEKLGDWMQEVDYHALHPMILKSELKMFMDDPSKWAREMTRGFNWGKSNKSNLEKLLNSLRFVHREGYMDEFPKCYKYLSRVKKLVQNVSEKYELSELSSSHLNGLFHNEFRMVFDFNEDFYSELGVKLGLDKVYDSEKMRDIVKLCTLQLLHGQHWKTDKASPHQRLKEVKEKIQANTIEGRITENEFNEQLTELLAELDESEWVVFYPLFCNKFPLLAIGIGYLQFCVSDYFRHTKRGKSLGYSRSLFYKESELMKEVVATFRCKPSQSYYAPKPNRKKLWSRRTILESARLCDKNGEGWDGRDYTIFPIYDCISVPSSVSFEAKHIMEAQAKALGYELRADVKPLAGYLPSKPTIKQETMSRTKVRPKKDFGYYLEKCFEDFKDEKSHTSVRRNGKTKPIRISDCESETDVEEKVRQIWDALGKDI